MTYQFKPAARQNTKLLFGLYGLSGSGKTMSSLLLARGLVGPEGRVCLIDTENRRGQLYADVIPGGYDTLDLAPPFSPKAYRDAVQAAIDARYEAIVIDSGSHEWEGEGGVLDMAGEVEKRTGRPGLHCWKEPKIEHQRLVQMLQRADAHVIVCLRAKFKSRQVKNQRGKTEIVKDDDPTPIQSEDFIFEMMAHAEMLPNHTMKVTKLSHPDLASVLRDGVMPSVDTGAALAAWSSGGDAPAASGGPALNGDSLLALGREAAARGKDGLQAWWKDLERPTRAIVKPYMDELKAIAVAADDTDLDADPFDGDDTPPAAPESQPTTDQPETDAFGLPPIEPSGEPEPKAKPAPQTGAESSDASGGDEPWPLVVVDGSTVDVPNAVAWVEAVEGMVAAVDAGSASLRATKAAWKQNAATAAEIASEDDALGDRLRAASKSLGV